jgi:cell division protein FtsB
MAVESIDAVGHAQLWLQGLGLFMAFVGSCAGAAWAGAKLAMRAFDVRMESFDKQIDQVLDSQKERRQTMAKLQEEITARVPEDRCIEAQARCSQLRGQSFCEMAKQVAALNSTIQTLNDKREKAKDEVHDMFTEIVAKISDLERRSLERRKNNGVIQHAEFI